MPEQAAAGRTSAPAGESAAAEAKTASNAKGATRNPNGRKGGEAHQRGVNSAEAKAKSEYSGQNVHIKKEGKIKTPNGEKSYRHGDVVVYDESGKPIKVYEVGNTLKDGKTAIKYERRKAVDYNRQEIEYEFLPKKEH